MTAFFVVVVFFLLGAVGVLAITGFGGSGSSAVPSNLPQPLASSATPSVPSGLAASSAGEAPTVASGSPPASAPTGPKTEGSLRFAVKASALRGTKLQVTLGVTNLTAEWTPFYGDDQVAVGADGRTIRAVATLTYLEPREAVTATLQFVLPAGFRVAHLQLHGDSGSTGVAVALPR